MKPALHRDHSRLFDLPESLAADRGLYVVARCNRVDANTPQIGPKVSQGETWISLHEVLAELCAWFAARSGAEVEVLDGATDPLSQSSAFVGLCCEEPGSKIHVSTKKTS